MIKWRKRDRDAGEGKDALPRYTNPEVSQAIAQAIAHGINPDEIAVAVTRDGKVYIGRAEKPTLFTRTTMKSRLLTKLSLWIGKILIRIFPGMAGKSNES